MQLETKTSPGRFGCARLDVSASIVENGFGSTGVPKLAPSDSARGAYELEVIANGDQRFWLAEPGAGPAPQMFGTKL